jgi:hypothetical protein
MANAPALTLGPSEKKAGIRTIPAATTGVINANLKKKWEDCGELGKEEKKLSWFTSRSYRIICL